MRVIFVEGRKATGKTTLCNIMAKSGNALYFDLVPVYNNTRKENLGFPGKVARVLYPGVYAFKGFTYKTFCEGIEEQILTAKTDVCVISGARSMYGINYITDYFNFDDRKIIYLDMDEDAQRQAYLSRTDTDKSHTRIGFEAYYMYESYMGIGKIKEYVLSNPETCLYCRRQSNDHKDHKLLQDAVRFAYNGQVEVSAEEIDSYLSKTSGYLVGGGLPNDAELTMSFEDA